MPNYFDIMLDDILFGRRYPRGTHETVVDKTTGEEVEREIDPIRQGPNSRKTARMEAGQRESDMLAYQLGGSRKLRKGESKPKGAYALANYPQLGIALMQAQQGLMAPGGGGANIGLWMKDRELGADPYAAMKRTEARKQWAANQRRLLGW